MANPKTIHDFGGFPQALFDQQYPAPGAPAVAATLARELKSPATGKALGVDPSEWGFDHGTWSVLKPMFPQATHPGAAAQHGLQPRAVGALCAGQAAPAAAQPGVLIVGSGNIVHNLRAVRRGVG
jgi:4,5-DOPA dioxygenase extradiol